MVLKRQNFATGPDGTAVTVANSDDVPGNDALDADVTLTTGVGSSLTYRTAAGLDRSTAQYVLNATVAAGAARAMVGWGSVVWGAASSQVWTRFYAWFPTLPVSTTHVLLLQLWSFDEVNGVYYTNWSMGIETNDFGQIYVLEKAQTAFGAIPVATNQWVRFEVRVQFSSTSTGNGEVLYFEQPDAPLTDYTESIAWSGWDDDAAFCNNVIYGFSTPVDSVNPATVYMSGLEINSTGYPGPAPFRAGKGVPGILSTPIAVHTNTW